jgi:hypothetical protein
MAALRKHGVTRMMIEAGGNIGLGDPPPETPGWRIGIGAADAQSPPLQYVWLSQDAVSTSGDMWQYAIIGGVRRNGRRARRTKHRRSLFGRGHSWAGAGAEAHRQYARRGRLHRANCRRPPEGIRVETVEGRAEGGRRRAEGGEERAAISQVG